MSSIITKRKEISNTFLKISFLEDITEEFGNTLPFPSKHEITTEYVYYWLIRGYFGTKKSQEYLNDIKSRFLINYKEKIKETSHFSSIETRQIHELKEFQKLKSISINIINHSNRFDSSNDFVFWCLKLYTEDLIRERGICQYSTLLEFGEKHFYSLTQTKNKTCKDYSTLKSKCKSIINYYINNNYKLDKYERKLTNEELLMLRSKNMLKVNENKKLDNNKIVKNFLTGMFVDDYKKNDNWNVSLISKTLKLSRNTIYRVIKEENL